MKKQILIIILSMIIGTMFFNNVYATNKFWKGTISNSWSDPNNWSPVGVPSSVDDVTIDGSAIRNCYLDISTTINGFYIYSDYSYQITIPAGNTLSIKGNIFIDAPAMAWINNSNIILSGDSDQSIEIIDLIGDYAFYELTINKPFGNVILNSDIIVSIFNIISGSIDCNGFSGPCPPPCTPPQTGGIYHIANDFAF